MKSNILKADPNLREPYAEHEEPSLIKLRQDTDEPMWKKSNTESDDPHLVKPYNEQEEPNLAKDLTDSPEPM
jgi:hypothetical protein